MIGRTRHHAVSLPGLIVGTRRRAVSKAVGNINSDATGFDITSSLKSAIDGCWGGDKEV